MDCYRDVCPGPAACETGTAAVLYGVEGDRVVAVHHPRGSAALRIIQYLSRYGETAGVVLAREIGFDSSAARGITRHAVDRGLIAIRKVDGRNHYSLKCQPLDGGVRPAPVKIAAQIEARQCS
jgi:hypothetical protein